MGKVSAAVAEFGRGGGAHLSPVRHLERRRRLLPAAVPAIPAPLLLAAIPPLLPRLVDPLLRLLLLEPIEVVKQLRERLLHTCHLHLRRAHLRHVARRRRLGGPTRVGVASAGHLGGPSRRAISARSRRDLGAHLLLRLREQLVDCLMPIEVTLLARAVLVLLVSSEQSHERSALRSEITD